MNADTRDVLWSVHKCSPNEIWKWNMFIEDRQMSSFMSSEFFSLSHPLNSCVSMDTSWPTTYSRGRGQLWVWCTSWHKSFKHIKFRIFSMMSQCWHMWPDSIYVELAADIMTLSLGKLSVYKLWFFGDMKLDY